MESAEISSVSYEEKQRKEIRNNKIKRFLFILMMIIVPVTNFLVFYFYVNFDAIMMAFKVFDATTSQYYYSFNNFGMVWNQLFNTPGKEMLVYLRNTISYFLSGLLILIPLTAVIGYFIYKKILNTGKMKYGSDIVKLAKEISEN